jgi:hypothetical protein
VILDTEVRLKNGSYYDRTQFIICDLCLWCASSIPGENLILRCPLCLDNKIRVMPISYNLNNNPPSGTNQEMETIRENNDIKDFEEVIL